MLDRYPEIQNLAIDTGSFAYRRSNQDPMERFFLAALCLLRKPKRIFEIGTYDGSTTLLLATHAPEAQVFTIDLPPQAAHAATVVEEAAHAASGRIGTVFSGRPENARIQQLLGDSRTFDFGPWNDSIDLVVVDGGHSYDCASADSRTALQLIAPGGMIVWDDYERGWPDVVRAVDETAVPTIQIASTGFAVYDSAS
jgi:predicted O-methyltransferase YrrM